MWTVRRADAADAPALALVAGATFLETYHAIIPVSDMVAHVTAKCSADMFAGSIADPASAVLYAGADVTDAPLGFAVLTGPNFPIDTDANDIELRRIYTLAATHGGGLGAALIRAAIDEARARGRRRMLLGVHPDNTRARRFYERTGFRVIGERVFTVGSARFVDPVYALDL
ncbi:GNAT family N-acetyltransferase [Sphingomonas sp.]|uniref:GNAT family N-acetyltransferase n=1 Tax=Sphingomonas sp. TaxID=28214 RepID=UPI0035BBF6B8